MIGSEALADGTLLRMRAEAGCEGFFDLAASSSFILVRRAHRSLKLSEALHARGPRLILLDPSTIQRFLQLTYSSKGQRRHVVLLTSWAVGGLSRTLGGAYYGGTLPFSVSSSPELL